uniref:Uncharacterized protein n=1 Tax=Triticum urartu TaxID=4572 RepID=A0A8R7P494_TRIUA
MAAPLHRLPTPPRPQVAPALHYLDPRRPIRIPTHLLPPSTLAAPVHHLVPRRRPPSTLACTRPPRSSRLLHVCRLILSSPGVSRHRAAPRRACLVPLRHLLGWIRHVRRGAGGEAPTKAMPWRFCSGNPALLAADAVEVSKPQRTTGSMPSRRSTLSSATRRRHSCCSSR